MNPPTAEELSTPVAAALLGRIVRFGHALRAAGLDANPGRLADFTAALPVINLRRRDDFYYAARSTLLSRPDQREAFDELFARFWPAGRIPLDAASDDESSGAPSFQPNPDAGEQGEAGEGEGAEQRAVAGAAAAADQNDGDQSEQDTKSPGTAMMSYSAQELLKEKNFGDFSEDELELARRLMERLRLKSARRLTRRMQRARQGRRLDLRRTVRRAFSTGGETLSWARKERKLKPRPLVLICDVSGSMERYTRLLLQFLHTVSQGTNAHVETFVFATRLTRITPSLKRRQVAEALDRVSDDVSDWSGGTRTGESLAVFNRHWGRRVLGRGAIVLIISDGWDRGDVDQLGREMSRLRRTSFRLMWLNPLLGSPNYRPLTRGMQAALPHLDDFLPAHNLNALEALVDRLAGLPVRRSATHDRPRLPRVVAKR